jgi:hypothetical protein
MSRSLLAASLASDSAILAAHSFLLGVSFLSNFAILAVSPASDSFILAVCFLSMAARRAWNFSSQGSLGSPS